MGTTTVVVQGIEVAFETRTPRDVALETVKFVVRSDGRSGPACAEPDGCPACAAGTGRRQVKHRKEADGT